MSKGRDFRGPRKRGFDDDSPSYDTPRTHRPPRSPYGPPGGGSGGFPDMAPAPTTPPVDAIVKWFKPDKGFGFVQSNDGGKDVFVHISVLSSSGVTRLMEGQPVTMRVVDTPKGREALSISAE